MAGAGVPRCSRSGGGLGGPPRTQGWAPAAHLSVVQLAGFRGRFQGRCGRSLRPSCSRPLALFGKAVGRLVPGKGCLAGFKGSFPLPSGLSREPELAGSSEATAGSACPQGFSARTGLVAASPGRCRHAVYIVQGKLPAGARGPARRGRRAIVPSGGGHAVLPLPQLFPGLPSPHLSRGSSHPF